MLYNLYIITTIKKRKEDFYNMSQRTGIYIHDIQTRWLDGLVSYNNFKEILKYIPGKNPKETIIKYCQDVFFIKVTKSEFKPILRKRSYYSKNSIVIIMAIYNILKEEVECNDQHLNSLIYYINTKNVNKKSYTFFSLGDRPEKIFDKTHALNIKYDSLIKFLNNTYKIIRANTNNDNIDNICRSKFIYDYFKKTDIDSSIN
jgi:hypothetical protein